MKRDEEELKRKFVAQAEAEKALQEASVVFPEIQKST